MGIRVYERALGIGTQPDVLSGYNPAVARAAVGGSGSSIFDQEPDDAYFADEFDSGPADLAARGYTVVNELDVPQTWAGEVDLWAMPNTIPANQYRASIIGSELWVQTNNSFLYFHRPKPAGVNDFTVLMRGRYNRVPRDGADHCLMFNCNPISGGSWVNTTRQSTGYAGNSYEQASFAGVMSYQYQASAQSADDEFTAFVRVSGSVESWESLLIVGKDERAIPALASDPALTFDHLGMLVRSSDYRGGRAVIDYFRVGPITSINGHPVV